LLNSSQNATPASVHLLLDKMLAEKVVISPGYFTIQPVVDIEFSTFLCAFN